MPSQYTSKHVPGVVVAGVAVVVAAAVVVVVVGVAVDVTVVVVVVVTFGVSVAVVVAAAVGAVVVAVAVAVAVVAAASKHLRINTGFDPMLETPNPFRRLRKTRHETFFSRASVVSTGRCTSC